MIWEFLLFALRLPFIMLAVLLVPARWRVGRMFCALWLHDMRPGGVWNYKCRVCGFEESAW